MLVVEQLHYACGVLADGNGLRVHSEQSEQTQGCSLLHTVGGITVRGGGGRGEGGGGVSQSLSVHVYIFNSFYYIACFIHVSSTCTHSNIMHLKFPQNYEAV